MTNAISEARTLDQVVRIINKSYNGESPYYFGGSDIREPEEMAAQYAYEAALESGYTIDEESLEYHLDILVTASAKFCYLTALRLAQKLARSANKKTD